MNVGVQEKKVTVLPEIKPLAGLFFQTSRGVGLFEGMYYSSGWTYFSK